MARSSPRLADSSSRLISLSNISRSFSSFANSVPFPARGRCGEIHRPALVPIFLCFVFQRCRVPQMFSRLTLQLLYDVQVFFRFVKVSSYAAVYLPRPQQHDECYHHPQQGHHLCRNYHTFVLLLIVLSFCVDFFMCKMQ
nr:MAG TPA: hypothetical protein [Caudoviricetes sp.]